MAASTEGEGRRFQAALMTSRILHGAMATSVVLFGVMLYFAGHQPQPLPSTPLGPGLYAFAGVICLGGLAAVVVGSVRLARALDGAVGVGALRRAFTPMIVRLAGAESFAVAGFFLSYLHGGTMMPFVAFAAASIVVILAMFPRASTFRFE
jgi:hypothetical protein